MDVTILRNPPLDSELRRQLVEIWVHATNAGGALGLLSPATVESARKLATATWRSIEEGADDLAGCRISHLCPPMAAGFSMAGLRRPTEEAFQLFP